MSKRFALVFGILCFCTFLYAGDAAAFVDLGFSSDGATYMFGQYGSTDTQYQAYADIYTIDVKSNTFVKDGVFSIKPSAKTIGKSGISVYNTLYNKNKDYILQYKPEPVSLADTLYIRSDSNAITDEIIFQDFERSNASKQIYYHIKLVPWFSDKTETSKSSFFISIEKQDENKNLLQKDVAGTPDIKRTGVIKYAIEKIMCDKSNNNLVFIVEKTIRTKDGLNIRYMAETISIK
ncbi:MAG: hypothetical protein BKP49_05485 [Treponema sp. CETP13]|nr:MAG: hypothetical protein BKP49_05485 [Treponema sp. CETP13]